VLTVPFAWSRIIYSGSSQRGAREPGKRTLEELPPDAVVCVQELRKAWNDMPSASARWAPTRLAEGEVHT